MRFNLRGRRSISVKLEGASCCSAHGKCRFICDAIQFAWQAQYLVKLEGASCCSARCKCRFTCHADREILFAWQA